MPHEPLALPDILAGLPDEADYGAMHAALMATERGRRFLAEFADRNRHADTTMVVGAIARVEAAIRGETAAPAAAAIADDLLEIAAAIDRLEAAIVVGAAEVADVSAAIERVSDIAFMLHERSVEASLCDALDAAVRDISRASLHPDAAAGGADNPTALVRALAARLGEMIARAIGPRGADQPAGDDVVAAAPGVGLLEMPVADGETFAQAVAALASSLPALDDAAESVSGAPPVAAAAIPSRDEDERPRAEPESGQGTAVPAAQAGSTENVAAPARETEVAADVPVPESEPGLPSQAASEFSLSEAVLAQAFSDDHFSAATAAAAAPAREEMRREEALSEQPPSEPMPSEDVLHTQNFSAAPVAGPEEDADDLFEPQPVATPPDMASVEATVSETTDAPLPAEPPAEPPLVVPPPPARAIPRPPAGDPLAAVRALSEEELIALFS
jgi:hypothetical protein